MDLYILFINYEAIFEFSQNMYKIKQQIEETRKTKFEMENEFEEFYRQCEENRHFVPRDLTCTRKKNCVCKR